VELLAFSQALVGKKLKDAQAWQVARDVHAFKLQLLWRSTATPARTPAETRKDA